MKIHRIGGISSIIIIIIINRCLSLEYRGIWIGSCNWYSRFLWWPLDCIHWWRRRPRSTLRSTPISKGNNPLIEFQCLGLSTTILFVLSVEISALRSAHAAKPLDTGASDKFLFPLSFLIAIYCFLSIFVSDVITGFWLLESSHWIIILFLCLNFFLISYEWKLIFAWVNLSAHKHAKSHTGNLGISQNARIFSYLMELIPPKVGQLIVGFNLLLPGVKIYLQLHWYLLAVLPGLSSSPKL